MFDDDAFEPSVGRQRSKGSALGKRYLGRVLAATALAGGMRTVRARRFDGSRIGRGAAIGRLVGKRDGRAAFRTRRVIIKSRIVKLAGKGVAAARAHLKYIERDGVTREGERGQLYSAEKDVADGKVFLEKSGGDRHQFRLIVSAEDGADYDDLKPLTRRLMAQVAADLGTELDWVAVDHFNTGHPHTHIILRGVDDQGQNLVISREYMGQGMRARLAELVSLDLGPRTDLEIDLKRRQDVSAERVTSLDRQLVREQSEQGHVAAINPDAFVQSLRAGRLQKLRQLGLAEPLDQGRWQLAPDLVATLTRMGERGDIIVTMQRTLDAQNLNRALVDRYIHEPLPKADMRITGRVVARGLSDELGDRHYLIIDATDGRSHYVEIGKGAATGPLPDRAIVRVAARAGGITETDRRIVAIAAQNGGRYSVDLHLATDASASEAYAQAHVRRLEAMRRISGGIERERDGRWIIAPDHLEAVAAYDAKNAKDRPVTIEIVSPLALEHLPRADGATWLDTQLMDAEPEPLRDSGFGREVKTALAVRQQWLLREGLAEELSGATIISPDLIATLRRRELMRVARQLAGELGLGFAEAKPGVPIEGVVTKQMYLASGRFALLTKAHEFTLVPWRDGLEAQIGKRISAALRGSGISWTMQRERGGPAL
jgi:type IV secretory pathway VirD2 relaxase